jgi:SAM-dependent methyltransferase
VHGDALDVLRAGGPFDLVFSSWVLGYIPLAPFFTAAAAALRPGGRLAFLVHRDGSPSEALEIFRELVAENPMVLRTAVAFDFPSDLDHARSELARAGFAVEAAYEGAVSFRYKTAEDAFEHLLKSGAGTTHYEAVDPAERGRMAGQFLTRLAARHPDGTGIPVIHDFIACVAVRA